MFISVSWSRSKTHKEMNIDVRFMLGDTALVPFTRDNSEQVVYSITDKTIRVISILSCDSKLYLIAACRSDVMAMSCVSDQLVIGLWIAYIFFKNIVVSYVAGRKEVTQPRTTLLRTTLTYFEEGTNVKRNYNLSPRPSNAEMLYIFHVDQYSWIPSTHSTDQMCPQTSSQGFVSLSLNKCIPFSCYFLVFQGEFTTTVSGEFDC